MAADALLLRWSGGQAAVQARQACRGMRTFPTRFSPAEVLYWPPAPVDWHRQSVLGFLLILEDNMLRTTSSPHSMLTPIRGFDPHLSFCPTFEQKVKGSDAPRRFVNTRTKGSGALQ